MSPVTRPVAINSVPDQLLAYEHAWRRYRRCPTERRLIQLCVRSDILYDQLRHPGPFQLGMGVMTSGARDVLSDAEHIPPEFLLRHKHGDWGELTEEETALNATSLRYGGRLCSSYRTRTAVILWVITDADRSLTTVLLPREYAVYERARHAPSSPRQLM